MSEYDVELDAVGVPAESKTGKAETEKLRPRAPRPAAKEKRPPPGRCRRWMHHRKGEYCKECGRVGT